MTDKEGFEKVLINEKLLHFLPGPGTGISYRVVEDGAAILTLSGEGDLSFVLYEEDGKIWLKRLRYVRLSADAEIKRMARAYGVSFDGSECRAEVSNAEDLVSAMIRFYAFSERATDLLAFEGKLSAPPTSVESRSAETRKEISAQTPDRTERETERADEEEAEERDDASDECDGPTERERMELEALRGEQLPEEEHSFAAAAPDPVETISAVLAENGITAEHLRTVAGAAVTAYDWKLAPDAPKSRVFRLDRAIGERLGVAREIRIWERFEEGEIRIEVPVPSRRRVEYGDLSPDREAERPGALLYRIGRDVDGNAVFGDLARNLHVLAGGASGSGKSAALRVMILSLAERYTPEEVRFLLADPKRVEFSVYFNLPHLLASPIIEPEVFLKALRWLKEEMERRLALFASESPEGIPVRDIEEYNVHAAEEKKLYRIVFVADELAECTYGVKDEAYALIAALSQRGRAAGIHMVFATQYSSSEVVSAEIKTSFPTRLIFRTADDVASRILLDESGAEKLLGVGDALYRSWGMYGSVRVQVCTLDALEEGEALDALAMKYPVRFDAELMKRLSGAEPDVRAELDALLGGDEETFDAESPDETDFDLSARSRDETENEPEETVEEKAENELEETAEEKTEAEPEETAEEKTENEPEETVEEKTEAENEPKETIEEKTEIENEPEETVEEKTEIENEPEETVEENTEAENEPEETVEEKTENELETEKRTPDDLSGGIEYFREALELAVKMRKISFSLLQRKLLIGYNHANRLIDRMAELGYVDRSDSLAMRVLLTEEEFERLFGPLR